MAADTTEMPLPSVAQAQAFCSVLLGPGAKQMLRRREGPTGACTIRCGQQYGSEAGMARGGRDDEGGWNGGCCIWEAQALEARLLVYLFVPQHLTLFA